MASSGLGMAPAQAMRIAESLYTSGYLSYPRTGPPLAFALSSDGSNGPANCEHSRYVHASLRPRGMLF